MKEFYLVEQKDDFTKYDFTVMPHFAPSASLEVIEGRLIKLSKTGIARKVQLFQSGILLSEITISDKGKISKKPVIDTRTDAEKDADFYYESRSRRTIKIGNSVNLNRWILTPDLTQETVPVKKRISVRKCAKRKNQH